MEVLRWIALGKTSKEIACELGLAPKTVEVHRANAYRKLGLHNMADATRWAIAHQLLARPLTAGEIGTALCQALGVE